MSLLTNAQNLYLEGIGKGDFENAIEKYSGEEYVQHSTGVETGQAGFKKFFADFTKRNPIREMNIVHSFQQGNLAFLFVVQNLGGVDTWLTMDIFAGDDNGKLIEHWDVIEEYKTPITHNFEFVVNTHDLKKIVTDNLADFKAYTSVVSELDYDYDNHKLYQILQDRNYVAMLSGFDSDDTSYAQITLLEFSEDQLIGMWSTTEPVIPEIANNSGKF